MIKYHIWFKVSSDEPPWPTAFHGCFLLFFYMTVRFGVVSQAFWKLVVLWFFAEIWTTNGTIYPRGWELLNGHALHNNKNCDHLSKKDKFPGVLSSKQNDLMLSLDQTIEDHDKGFISLCRKLKDFVFQDKPTYLTFLTGTPLCCHETVIITAYAPIYNNGLER